MRGNALIANATRAPTTEYVLYIRSIFYDWKLVKEPFMAFFKVRSRWKRENTDFHVFGTTTTFSAVKDVTQDWLQNN